MKFLSIHLVLALFLGVNTSFLIHGEETPHGGIVIHATNGFNIEKVHGIKRLFFYLLKDDERTTIRDEKLSGSVEFILKDGSKEKHDLILSKNEETLKIVFKEKKKIKITIVHIKYKKKIITAKFK